jgi:hypothetical protein
MGVESREATRSACVGARRLFRVFVWDGMHEPQVITHHMKQELLYCAK